MRLLISTEPGDTDSVVVKCALEKMGHFVRLLFNADQPTRQTNSVSIDSFNYQWKSTDKYNSYLDEHYDIVWWRRTPKPYLPTAEVHPADYTFLLKENILFNESLTSSMAPNAWWVNSKEASTKADSKLLQLRIATACEMPSPARGRFRVINRSVNLTHWA